MKNFDRFIITVSVMILVFFVILYFIIFNTKINHSNLYKVEINRIEQEIAYGNSINTDNFDTIIGVYQYNPDMNFYNSENEYVIREINGTLYRIEYDDTADNENIKVITIVNILLLFLFLLFVSVMLYIRYNIIQPFKVISDYPYQLAKGNLSVPLKENKNRYFGKFIWGLDMLRETLEKSKIMELERAKKEKTFLMSLSHDIKTPLSAIKLYSKAISKGLYTGRKQIEVAENINSKADEIEEFVNEIISNLSSDFMTFETTQTEFYLSQVIDKITAYYADKLYNLGIDFNVCEYTDCLITGDTDRLEEVLQNIIENAVKYGDGHYIFLSFSDEEDCRLITVSNSGCTLPDTELPYIFDSFWRGSNTGTREGCGLGLYICRRLMNAMNGDIFAEISDDCMNITLVCQKTQ
ncbi:MAG: HAMP domain-containing histidine kinase [Ruminococcus sp.]|nr:HAMP domain-containing histidine kinase [Ruminococcus sp.]